MQMLEARLEWYWIIDLKWYQISHFYSVRQKTKKNLCWATKGLQARGNGAQLSWSPFRPSEAEFPGPRSLGIVPIGSLNGQPQAEQEK